MINDHDIRRIYDKTNRDISFEEFAREVKETLDPVRAQQELHVILAKREIDRKIRR